MAAQKSLRQHILEKDPVIGAKIISLKADKDKTRRLLDVSRYFEMRLISVMSDDLHDNLLDFPSGILDVVDAAVYAIKMYERNHPLQPTSGDFSPIDQLSTLGQNELESYIQKAIEGIPGYTLTGKWKIRYQQAIELQNYAEDFLND